MDRPSPLALVPPPAHPATTSIDVTSPDGMLDVFTARWRRHVLNARSAGVPRATLERELRQMTTQLDLLYPGAP